MVKVYPVQESDDEFPGEQKEVKNEEMGFCLRVFYCFCNMRNCKISSVIVSCVFITLTIWVLAITLSLVLFFVYDEKEKDKNSEKIDSLKSFASLSLQRELSNVERIATTIQSFIYETSDTMTKEKFSRFVQESGIASLEAFVGAHWIVDVPSEREDYWRKSFIPSVGLSSSEISTLNGTAFSPIYEHHYMVTLTEPHHYYFFGIDMATHGPLLQNTIENDEPQYYISSQYSGLDIYYPIIKTNHSMNNSRVVNSALKVRFVFDPLANEAFEVYGDEVLFALYSEGKCLIQTCKDPGSFADATDTFDPTGGENKVDWALDISMAVTPLDEFYDYELRTSKVFGLLGPLIAAIIFGLLLIPVCVQCIQYVKKSSEMKVIKQVSKSLSEMNFTSRQIIKLEGKFNPSKVEKYMKKIVKNMKLYRSYLPRTLLDQLEETKKKKKKSRKVGGKKNNEFLTFFSDERKNNEVVEMLELEKTQTTSDGDDLSRTASSTTITSEGTFRSLDTSSQSTFLSTSSSNASRNSLRRRSMRKRRKNLFLSKSSIQELSKYSTCNEKNVVVMIVRMDNFDEDYFSFSSLLKMEEFQSHFQEWISMIIGTVKRFGGEFLYFIGDKIFFSWNAVRIQMEGTRKSVLAAFELIKLPFFEKRKISITVSLTRGVALVGHFNISKHDIRQFDILGYPLSTALEMLNEKKSNGWSVIYCDEEVRSGVRYISESMCVDSIKKDMYQFGEEMEEKSVGYMKVYQLLSFLGKKSQDSVEWMYQCKAGFDRNENEDYQLVEDAWDCFVAGNEEKTMEMIKIVNEVGQGERIVNLMEKVKVRKDWYQKEVFVEVDTESSDEEYQVNIKHTAKEKSVVEVVTVPVAEGSEGEITSNQGEMEKIEVTKIISEVGEEKTEE